MNYLSRDNHGMIYQSNDSFHLNQQHQVVVTLCDTTTTDWVMVVPCDMPLPFLPENLVAELWRHKGHVLAVWIRSEEREHLILTLRV